MTGRVHFAYAQAGLQARYGRMAGPAEWRRLDRVSDFGQFLQVAGSTGLRPWLRHLGPGSDVHQIELGLRLRFREHVQRVATWVPVAWRPAVAWCARLEDLEAVEYLLAGHAAPAWMAHDPLYRPVAAAPREKRPGVIARTGVWPAPSTNDQAPDAPRRWRHHWTELWPEAEGAPVLGWLGGVLTAPVPDRRNTRSLERCFRSDAQRPPAIFAYLAIVRGELSRLRGALVRRRLLPAA